MKLPYRDESGIKYGVQPVRGWPGVGQCGEGELQSQYPGDDLLGDEAQHAEGEYEEQYESAEPSGFGLLGKVPDDEQHEQHESAQPESQAEFGDLFFC